MTSHALVPADRRLGAFARAAVFAALAFALAAAAPCTAAADYYVSGTQTGVWDNEGGAYIITGDVTVPAGGALTIFAGVAVKFYAGRSMIVNGTLTTLGVPTEPVTFTSSNDPDGDPAPGDWGAIFVQDGGVVDFSNTYMRYGGAGGYANLCY